MEKNHDKRRWAEILEITEKSGKKEKKARSLSCLASNVGGVEESGNKFVFIFFISKDVLKDVLTFWAQKELNHIRRENRIPSLLLRENQQQTNNHNKKNNNYGEHHSHYFRGLCLI